MRKSHLITGALFLLATVLIARLIWIASQTETGWSLLKRQWLDATVGLVLGEQVPISRQEPADQADFWLKEVKRITDAEPDNAELAMGAAIALRFTRNRISISLFNNFGISQNSRCRPGPGYKKSGTSYGSV